MKVCNSLPHHYHLEIYRVCQKALSNYFVFVAIVHVLKGSLQIRYIEDEPEVNEITMSYYIVGV